MVIYFFQYPIKCNSFHCLPERLILLDIQLLLGDRSWHVVAALGHSSPVPRNLDYPDSRGIPRRHRCNCPSHPSLLELRVPSVQLLGISARTKLVWCSHSLLSFWQWIVRDSRTKMKTYLPEWWLADTHTWNHMATFVGVVNIFAWTNKFPCCSETSLPCGYLEVSFAQWKRLVVGGLKPETDLGGEEGDKDRKEAKLAITSRELLLCKLK